MNKEQETHAKSVNCDCIDIGVCSNCYNGDCENSSYETLSDKQKAVNDSNG